MVSLKEFFGNDREKTGIFASNFGKKQRAVVEKQRKAAETAARKRRLVKGRATIQANNKARRAAQKKGK